MRSPRDSSESTLAAMTACTDCTRLIEAELLLPSERNCTPKLAVTIACVATTASLSSIATNDVN